MADEFQDLQSLACEDCIAEILLDWHRGIGGRVLLASIRHEDTCPWLFRVAPQGATLTGPHGILMHWSNATANPPKVEADER